MPANDVKLRALIYPPVTGDNNSRSVVMASLVALALLIVWWVALRYGDEWLAMTLPYGQYEAVTLLYPEVYYPGLPGWMLAGFQPFSLGIYIFLFGGVIVVAILSGLASTWYANRNGQSPMSVAALSVLALFVGFAILEEVIPFIT